MADKGTRLFEELMRFRPEGFTPNRWAVKAGVGRNFWNDLKRHGNPSRRTLEKLLAVAGSNLAEFEALRIGQPAAANPPPISPAFGETGPDWRQAPVSLLPVIDSQAGGEWGGESTEIEVMQVAPERVVDRLVRPASLIADSRAYAVTIVGDAMWPRYRPGRRVAVSPLAPVGIGDDVLVTLHGGDEGRQALLKELVRRSAASLELRQFNPDKTFVVAAAAIESVHKVIGELI
jgi:phage repressor protein C with HTH and peptisase S24 domain